MDILAVLKKISSEKIRGKRFIFHQRIDLFDRNLNHENNILDSIELIQHDSCIHSQFK